MILIPAQIGRKQNHANSAESCVREKRLSVETVRVIVLPSRTRLSAGSRIARTVLARSQLSRTVILDGSKRSRKVLAIAKYDGVSAGSKNSGLVCSLCS